MRYLNMWFRENLGLKIISVIIAFLLWAHVMAELNGPVARELEARIAVINTPKGLTKLRQSPDSAKILVSGPIRQVQNLTLAQRTLAADLSGLGAGEHTVPLKPPNLPTGVRLESVTPATVVVMLDKEVSESRPLTVRLRGEPASGYALGTPQPSRPEAKVTGAASLLARLSRLVAEADASGLDATAERTATIRPLDDKGDAIEGLHVSPTEVTVVVPVTRGSQGTKTVPIRPQVGEPAAGYKVTEVTSEPTEITLSGSPAAIGALESISTEMIPIEGLTNAATYDAKVVLPAGVKRVGEGGVKVSVKVVKTPEGPGTEAAGAGPPPSGPAIAPAPEGAAKPAGPGPPPPAPPPAKPER